MMQRLRRGVGAVLQAGPVPVHVAFIMDGNRRYADRDYSGDVSAGHTKGFSKLLEALEWCVEVGIKCVSVFAFSIDNFNRSAVEVDALMRLAEIKLQEMLEERAIVEQHGVQVRVLGDLTLLPKAVQKSAHDVMEASKHHNKVVLNICLAYSSSQEMGSALQKIRAGVARGGIESHQINQELFQQQLYTRECPPVDLLVRTSGECRLSDFLLWQSSRAVLYFTPVLWPDFTFLHLLRAIVHYQRAVAALPPITPPPRRSGACPAQRNPAGADFDASRLQDGGAAASGSHSSGLAGRGKPSDAACELRVGPTSGKRKSVELATSPVPESEGAVPGEDTRGERLRLPSHDAAAAQDQTKPGVPDEELRDASTDEARSSSLGRPAARLESPTAESLDRGGGADGAVAPGAERWSSSSGGQGSGATPPLVDVASSAGRGGRSEEGSQTSHSGAGEQNLAVPGFVTAPPRRRAAQGLTRRKRAAEVPLLLDDSLLDPLGMFAKPAPSPEARAAELRRNGFAGGYDSMEEDDEDDMHVNGCPCCLVKFLPMHRICTDPTPAVMAMKAGK